MPRKKLQTIHSFGNKRRGKKPRGIGGGRPRKVRIIVNHDELENGDAASQQDDQVCFENIELKFIENVCLTA